MPRMTTPPESMTTTTTTTESLPPDPWQCATEDISQYLNPPKPTGALLAALQSYGDELLKTCTFTGASALDCPFPASSDWCKFSAVAPSTMLPAYVAYGSEVNSWWEARSSTVSVLQVKCPVSWHEEIIGTPGGEAWLNSTVAQAGCYADAHLTSEAQSTSTSTSK